MDYTLTLDEHMVNIVYSKVDIRSINLKLISGMCLDKWSKVYKIIFNQLEEFNFETELDCIKSYNLIYDRWKKVT